MEKNYRPCDPSLPGLDCNSIETFIVISAAGLTSGGRLAGLLRRERGKGLPRRRGWHCRLLLLLHSTATHEQRAGACLHHSRGPQGRRLTPIHERLQAHILRSCSQMCPLANTFSGLQKLQASGHT